jgi:hypothetical protein
MQPPRRRDVARHLGGRRHDGSARAHLRLGGSPARSAGELAHEPEDHRGYRARQPLPHAAVVGPRPVAAVQRRLPPHPGGQAPRLARSGRARGLGRDLAHHRAHGRGRAGGRARDLERAPAAAHHPQGLRRGDLLHLLLQSRARRRRPDGRRARDRAGDDRAGAGRSAAADAQRARGPDRRGYHHRRGLHLSLGRAVVKRRRLPLRAALPRERGRRAGHAGRRPHPRGRAVRGRYARPLGRRALAPAAGEPVGTPRAGRAPAGPGPPDRRALARAPAPGRGSPARAAFS